MNEENKLIEIFNSFVFSNDCKLIKIQYDSAFFGNFLIEIQYGLSLFRIINDRNQLFIERYDKVSREWNDVDFTSIKTNSKDLKEILYNAFNYINSK